MDDIKQLLAILSRDNLGRDLSGELHANFNASFFLKDVDRADVNFHLEKLSLLYEGERIESSNTDNIISISKGLIKQWNIKLHGNKNSLTSSGVGNLGKKFNIPIRYTLDAKVLGILFSPLYGASGMIKGTTIVRKDNNNTTVSSAILGRNTSFSHQRLQGIFEEVDFDIISRNERITIKSMKGQYGRGTVSIAGDITLGVPYPKPNLSIEFNNIGHDLFSRSSLVTSGKVSLVGSTPPYLVNGNIVINKLLFLDNLMELTKNSGNSYVYSKYLPRRKTELANGWFRFNLDVDGKNSIEIKSNIIDAFLSSNVKITGNLNGPLVKGSAFITPGSSRIFFKGQEFSLENGRVDFRDTTNKESPFLHVEGASVIGEYRVFLSIVGNTDNLNINLKSEPALVQKDILSLITLGYTSDVSESLDEGQKQFLTTMSLGGLLIDQLRIGRNFNQRNRFRLSVAPEFDDSSVNLIQNKTSETGGVRKLPSLTKLKLQSNIGEKTTVSVSSSLGVEDKEAQELKVDYNLNENISIQSVYENTTVEYQTQQTNSFGGDIRFRWPFGE